MLRHRKMTVVTVININQDRMVENRKKLRDKQGDTRHSMTVSLSLLVNVPQTSSSGKPK